MLHSLGQRIPIPELDRNTVTLPEYAQVDKVLHMYVCVYMYVCICMCVCIGMCVYVCVYMCGDAARVRASRQGVEYVCMCVYVCMCMYVCVCVYV